MITNVSHTTHVLTAILCAMLSFFPIATLAQSPASQRGVISSGGQRVSTNNGQEILNGSVGQFAIGRIREANTKNNVGFWYGAVSLFAKPNSESIIELPNVTADIGVMIDVPLILVQSKNLQRVKAKSFEAVIRYNIHVLESKQWSGVRSGDSMRITVKGTLQSNDTLLSIPFLTKLGNAEYTPLIIEKFTWLESPTTNNIVRNGRVDFTGICHEGDTTRLVFSAAPTALLSVFPNPVNEEATVRFQVGEKGQTDIALVDMNGRVVMGVYSGKVERLGEYTETINVSTIASGLYYAVLRSRTRTQVHQVIVRK